MSSSNEYPYPTDSIDALLARQLPAWVSNATGGALRELHLALKQEQASAEQVKQLLGRIPGLTEYATPLLEQALQAQHNVKVDVRNGVLCTVVRKEFPSIFPLPPIVRTVRTASVPLLAAALHNFAEEELQARPLVRRRLESASGAPLPISFVQFAKLCRELDLGGGYQAVLHEHLLPPDVDGSPAGAPRRQVEALLEEASRAAMEAAVRLALLKGQIQESSYLQLLRVFSRKASVPADTAKLKYRQLFVLGKCVQGVVVVEVWDSQGSRLQNLLLWTPGDPEQPVRQYSSWQALYQALGGRLREASYARYFSRFIAETDRVAFCTKLEHLLTATKVGTELELDGRNFPITEPLFAYLRAQRLNKILGDAKALAVPTGVEDAASRNQRLKGYENAGLTLLGLAGLFVPVLGEVMMGVAALEIADEVYEGYQDWQLGDREAALGHLFSVAENVALGAAVGVGVAAGAKVLERVMFVDELAPVVAESGRVKLCTTDLAAYRLEQHTDLSVWQIHADPQGWHLHLHDGAFKLAGAADGKGLSIRHPLRESAYRPRLERNGSGGWRHALEQPQEWGGELRLLRRLDARFADITQEQATALLDCTGFDEARLRQLCAEGAPAPARLQDAFERYRLHALHPTVEAQALEVLVAQAQEAEEVEDALLRRSFPGLSVRGAKEIRKQVDGRDLEQLNKTGRVSLAMAERVRWFLGDSRLDRACAGLRLRQAVTTDTEKLAIGLVHELAAWPETLRVELREGASGGPVLGQVGAELAQQVISIVRQEQGYSVHMRTVGAQANTLATDSFMNALLLCMGDEQKLLLGDAMLTEPQLVEKLAAYARDHRELSSRLIGQVPIAGGVRPPVRFADGRLGYPLSGRGESRGQASRRGIRQIFPTFDDAQMQQYMLDLVSRGVDSWSHYEALHAQWGGMRQALASWRAEYVRLVDLLRRSRVVNTIRRCWRRKSGRRADGTYALEVRGERVGSLPQLPDGIMFEHVTRLVLRDMDLAEIDADFLGRFPNLTELDLRSNRLLSIPHGLEHLTELRVLRLDNNQIVFTQADSQRLNALINLERLELNYNPLGDAPAVRQMLSLRAVGMRAAEIEALPARIEQMPWRGIADLRENRIQRVNQDLQGLRVRLQQMALHDNPLDEASERYLQEQPGPSSAVQPVVRHSPDYRHHLVRQAELSTWLTGSTGAQRIEREMLWSNLRHAPGGDDFFNFLRDFAQSPDYLKYPAYYRARVWAIIEACEQNSELRELLFEQAGGVATCEDRLLWVFSQMEIRALVHRETAGLPQMQSERALLKLGRSLYRLQELDRIAAEKLTRLREEFANSPARLESIDDVETYLAYRVRLAWPLQIPGQPVTMHYLRESLVTTEDINVARVEILTSESSERLMQSLANQEYWQDYLRATYSGRFRALVDAQREFLEAYDRLVAGGSIDELTYLERCNELKTDLEVRERALIEQLTAEAYSRWSV